MKSKHVLGAIVVLTLLASFVPAKGAVALAPEIVPPVDMFQLPWEQGLSWVAYDGFDNGFKRLLNSPHFYLNGGAVDFAPHNNMRLGEDTSKYWVTAAAAGTVVQITSCSLMIAHGNGWITDYQFLAHIQVKLGDAVYRNERLAIIADGLREKFCPPALEPDIPHVHFSLRPNMRDATFSGWLIQYTPLLNKTTFTKGGLTLGSFQPILNAIDLQIVLREVITWDTVYTGSVDAFRYERWPFVLSEMTNFTLTTTPTTSGLIPLLVLLDANGNEITRGAGTLTTIQPAGTYAVQVQPQAGSGFYNLLLHKNSQPVPSGLYVSTVVTPTSIAVGDTAAVTISLGNVPADGYTSTEFTCTYNASLAEASTITAGSLFGADPVVAINGPQNGSFIVAIAGSNGNRATASGAALTFSLKGLQAGQTAVECKARVSKGDNILTDIQSTAGALTVGASTPTPTSPPTSTTTTQAVTNTPTTTPTAPGTDTTGWNTWINTRYLFSFKYPPDSTLVSQTDTGGRIDLPFAHGTNLLEKHLDVSIVEDVSMCKSPQSQGPNPQVHTENVTFNGIPFLKETWNEAATSHRGDFTAYSTVKGNACISLTFWLWSVVPEVVETPPPPFDPVAETAVFPIIMSTFEMSSPQATATETPTATPTATETSTPTPTPLPAATLTGRVLASKPVTVSLFNADASLAASVSANADGTFSLTAAPGTYTALAAASGFLKAQGSVMLSDGQTSTLSTVSLLAGDIDGNNVIDQFDAMTIGMSYNTGSPAAADLNNDGIINVLDLELLAHNYRASGSLAWE